MNSKTPLGPSGPERFDPNMTRSVYLLFLLVGLSTALHFYIPGNGKKCLKEEIHKNVVVIGVFEMTEDIGYTTSVHVTDTRGHTLYKRERFHDVRGKFSFTADIDDTFEICISSHSPAGKLFGPDREVSLLLKHGVEAKNYEDIAKAEKLKPLEVELRRLEDLSESIVRDYTYMRQKEEEMRSTNESTNSRILYLSIFSMVCLLGLATWQVLYLRRYFKAKKLID